MIAAVLIAAIAGMVLGYAIRAGDEEECPARVLGYNCKGDHCDHRLSVLYGNMASMAKAEEERKSKENENLWGGDEY